MNSGNRISGSIIVPYNHSNSIHQLEEMDSPMKPLLDLETNTYVNDHVRSSKKNTAPQRTTFEIKRVVSTKNNFIAPKTHIDYSIKKYLKYLYFWPSIIYTALNITCFEIGFQLIRIEDYEYYQPLTIISTVSCFGPIFNMLLSIMMYWNTFR